LAVKVVLIIISVTVQSNCK